MNIKQLIQGCQSNDRRCQKALVEQFSEMLFTVSLRYARDAHAAKDILQESWIKILKYIVGFDANKGALDAWMRKIVINTALQSYKGLRHKIEKSGLEHVAAPAVIPDVYAQLGAAELMALIKRLPEGYQVVFNLYVVEGYSHHEIGELLGIKPGSSRSQLNRARKQLQALILEQENNTYHESRAV